MIDLIFTDSSEVSLEGPFLYGGNMLGNQTYTTTTPAPHTASKNFPFNCYINQILSLYFSCMPVF